MQTDLVGLSLLKGCHTGPPPPTLPWQTLSSGGLQPSGEMLPVWKSFPSAAERKEVEGPGNPRTWLETRTKKQNTRIE